jgi:hypothetical protein
MTAISSIASGRSEEVIVTLGNITITADNRLRRRLVMAKMRKNVRRKSLRPDEC